MARDATACCFDRPRGTKQQAVASRAVRAPTGLTGQAANCSSSVLPCMAVVEDLPAMMVFCTASK